MIESVSLKNFQCHKKLVLKLSPTLTCLVGKTRAGKSAALRGLKWLATNRPSGSSFLRHGTKSVTVQIIIDEKTLTRRKGDSNTYEIDDKELAAIGQGVPDEVTSLLNVDSRNFQGQHDAPFWLSLSPGEVSRELNQVVNLELMDRCLSNITSEVRSAVLEESQSYSRVEKTRKNLSSLDWVVSFAERTQALAIRENELNATQQHRDALEATLAEVATYLPLATLNVPIEAVCTLIDGLEALEARQGTRERLRQLLDEISKLEQEIRECESRAKKLEKQYHQTTGDVCPLCQQRTSGKSPY